HDPKSHGWPPDNNRGRPHELVLGFEQTVPADQRNQLRIVIDQQAKVGDRAGQTLGRFRFSVTDDPQAATAATVPPAIRTIAQLAPDKRSSAQREEIAKYYRSLQPELKEIAAQQDDIERRLHDEYKPDKTPIMKELPADKQRVTHVFHRGSFLSP